ncbi:hypothetical protein C0971_12020 [Bacillus methanolicus]|uniref:hypothetical protein n=1 Tax=Bacillus methanolicus TaxID=1471 RepID=UPI0020106104|nr:hypothetical protein [Bacillus methanolicus]UQD52674.1 hypothetical protein C0971_12020 [Bacillus methanolicus]
MKKYVGLGEINLHVSKEIQAPSEQKAWQKIMESINNLTADIRSIKIETVDGEIHEVDVDLFHIKWDEVYDKNVPV